MGNFLQNVFVQLQQAADRVVLREVRGEEFVSVSGRELLEQISVARDFIRQSGVQPGDRCALLGPNSIQWIAIDLALMAEGGIVVPLYSRQAPAELAVMLRDSGPKMLFVSDAALGEEVANAWVEAPARVVISEVLTRKAGTSSALNELNARKDEDLVAIIYTSGTSGEPKGVCLNTANLNHMLGCTTEWIDRLERNNQEPMRVFQYLPFNFAASWIVVMSCLTRETVLTLSTDLNRVADEIRLSAPNYFFNVPTLLERVKRGVEEALGKRDAAIQAIFHGAVEAWKRQQEEVSKFGDGVRLFLGRKLIFEKIRARFGQNLKGLVCGSAPLAPETQDFFAMLGIPIWQVYGLTETTGICTMDDPCIDSEPGRVGKAVAGIEMKVGDNEEILVRGPNIFAGYWNRPEETAKVLRDGWFQSGDQGELNSRGNWRISGRIKNLIILNSGHNIAPEPIEEKIAQQLVGAQQVVLVGNGRGYLCALVTGSMDAEAVQGVLHAVNSELPHYRQVRNFTILPEAFTPESGLLTANGKLRRDAINGHYREVIDGMYLKNAATAGGKSQ
jgi:long-chain acyl-CoA synthetase